MTHCTLSISVCPWSALDTKAQKIKDQRHSCSQEGA